MADASPDHLPVLAEVRRLPERRPASHAPVPLAPREKVQVASLAAAGFLAGTLAAAMIRRRRIVPRPLRRRRDRLNVVASRSFLVDVHLVERGK
ncbi:MAG TPA: hypothetical protein VK279_08405 [Solirubrobacteraceae bacterium]|nr:hypothetical protein [Solirubrobacteraceae bacterium]